MAAPFTIFRAREIVTMNPSNPSATHVAVRDGRILGAGPLDELTVWGDHVVDDTFAELVLVPGMIDVHAHVMEGAMWALDYIGYFPRTDPDGVRRGGLRSIDEVVAHLRAVDASMPDPTEPIVCWGLDPIYFPGERLVAAHLDTVSTERPILALHASLHVATVNTAMLRLAGITADTETEGVVRGPDGQPNGELQEAPAMMLTPVLLRLMHLLSDETSYHRLGRIARNAGITTIGDLGGQSMASPAIADTVARVVNDPTFPVRMVQYCVPAFGSAPADDGVVIERFRALQATSTDKLRYGGIKIVADGSIQGYTAVLRWPGYVTGAPNGLWQVPPHRLPEMVAAYHRAGINVHVHCNGDAIVDAFVDAVDLALRDHAWLDHRHTVQHCQLASAAQFRRMANLGMCANLFANHLWFWGDQHFESTVGPERAHRMEAAATALREGVHISLHSDANVTPLGQLHTMWCVMNRVTPSGRVLGPAERIGAYDALHAVTVDAAYQMHLDHDRGSIEVGKLADFTVLGANPLTVEPMAVRDIPVWGTVVGGVPYAAAAGS